VGFESGAKGSHMEPNLVTGSNLLAILAEFKQLAHDFRCPAGGKTKAGSEEFMGDGFWAGVSGHLYGKEFVLDCLVKRSQALFEVEAKGFKLYPD